MVVGVWTILYLGWSRRSSSPALAHHMLYSLMIYLQCKISLINARWLLIKDNLAPKTTCVGGLHNTTDINKRKIPLVLNIEQFRWQIFELAKDILLCSCHSGTQLLTPSFPLAPQVAITARSCSLAKISKIRTTHFGETRQLFKDIKCWLCEFYWMNFLRIMLTIW